MQKVCRFPYSVPIYSRLFREVSRLVATGNTDIVTLSKSETYKETIKEKSTILPYRTGITQCNNQYPYCTVACGEKRSQNVFIWYGYFSLLSFHPYSFAILIHSDYPTVARRFRQLRILARTPSVHDDDLLY